MGYIGHPNGIYRASHGVYGVSHGVYGVSHGTYGGRKITCEINSRSENLVNHKRGECIMRENDVVLILSIAVYIMISAGGLWLTEGRVKWCITEYLNG